MKEYAVTSPVSLDSQPYLAPAIPGSISLLYLFLLFLPLLLGGGLCEVLGLAELLGGLCHGAAATAASAPVAVAPALLSFALPPVVPVSSSCVPLSPEPPSLTTFPLVATTTYVFVKQAVQTSGSRYLCVCVCLCVFVCVMPPLPVAATTQPPAATKKDATASGADAGARVAAATAPVGLHCAELPPLPLLSSLPSSLLSSPPSCLHRTVTQSGVQHGGDPAAALPPF